MRDQHRLRRPEVREGRHQRVAGRRAPARASAATTRATRLLQQRNPPPQIEPQIERHLLVARPAGVQPPAGVAEPLDEQPLDEAVHVFVGARRRTPGSRGRARGCRASAASICRASSRGKHAGPAERPRPREAARHVVFEQAAIEAERRAELERRRIGRRVEAAGPESCHQSSSVDGRRELTTVVDAAARPATSGRRRGSRP